MPDLKTKYWISDEQVSIEYSTFLERWCMALFCTAPHLITLHRTTYHVFLSHRLSTLLISYRTLVPRPNHTHYLVKISWTQKVEQHFKNMMETLQNSKPSWFVDFWYDFFVLAVFWCPYIFSLSLLARLKYMSSAY